MTSKTRTTSLAAGVMGFLALARPGHAQTGSLECRCPIRSCRRPTRRSPSKSIRATRVAIGLSPVRSRMCPAAIDCGEVIVPPPRVDPDIAEPPREPGAGTMPIIPPRGNRRTAAVKRATVVNRAG